MMRRRRLVLALIGVPVLGAALGACTAEPSAKLPAPGDPPDADTRLRWRAIQAEHGLLVLHAAAVAKHAALDELIAPVSAHHREHLQALLEDGPIPRVALVASAWRDGSGSGDTSLSGAKLGANALPDVPDNPGAALELVRDTEQAASAAGIAECLQASGPRLAMLLASIAAAEAAHDITLAAA